MPSQQWNNLPKDRQEAALKALWRRLLEAIADATTQEINEGRDPREAILEALEWGDNLFPSAHYGGETRQHITAAVDVASSICALERLDYRDKAVIREVILSAIQK